jgi:hypothetical protein
MSFIKNDWQIVGKGDVNQNTNCVRVLASNNLITTWSGGTTYALGNVVEYLGGLYRSLANSNTGNTPAVLTAFWELYVPGTTDGDICLVTAIGNSDVIQRRNGIWTSVSGQPVSVTLPVNTANNTWLSLSLGVARHIFIDYSIERNGNRRSSSFAVASDGTDAFLSEYGAVELPASCGTTMNAVVSGGNLLLQSTTDNTTGPVNLKYVIRRWS